jgi:dihydropyrimidinase
MGIIIKNGTIVTPQRSYLHDIYLNDGKIVAMEENLNMGNCEVIDASGCLLFPGFIDAHTHIGGVLTADDFNTGTKAAIAGGTTSILDFAAQKKGETLSQTLDEWHRKSEGICSCDYGFHISICDWNPSVADEIPLMADRGVTSFKLFMVYEKSRVRDGEIYEILKRVKDIKGIVGAHCENGDLVNCLVDEFRHSGKLTPQYHALSRPDIVEAEAVCRYLYIAELADTPVNIVHLSCRKSLKVAIEARKRGQKVYIETCPQYLVLDDTCYTLPDFEGSKYVCSPPIRSNSDQNELWAAVATGDIDTISSDHCGFNFEIEKKQGVNDFSKIANGLPGVEHRPAIIYTQGVLTGKITVNQMVSLMSENIARLYGMFPRKGAIAVGSDADIVVWDPEYKGIITASEQNQDVDYTPYEGMEVRGRAKAVLLRGEQVVSDGKVICENRGTYLHRGSSDFYR